MRGDGRNALDESRLSLSLRRPWNLVHRPCSDHVVEYGKGGG